MAESGDDSNIQPKQGPLDGLTVTRLRPAYQQVAGQLRELILSGSLVPGDRLPPEGDLAASFGVSRSTVREALRVLASRDLVQTKRGTTGGTFVLQVEFDQVSNYLETSIGLLSGSKAVTVTDMLEAREILEVPAAELAAERRGDGHLAAMGAAIEREMVSRGRSGRFAEHRTFHQIIVEAAGNGLLGMMTEPVFRVLRAKFLSSDVPASFWKHVDHDHETILRAIQDGDRTAAADAMRSHLDELKSVYTD